MTYTADTSARYRGRLLKWTALAVFLWAPFATWASVAQADSSDTDRRAQPRLVASVGAGAGVAERRIALPASSGERKFRSGSFAAADLVVHAEGRLRFGFSLSADAHYQTSVGLTASESFADRGAETRTSVRSHHLDLGLAPGYRFDVGASVDVRMFVGWWMRGLRSVTDLEIPSYSLQGPVFRPELYLGFFQRRMILKVAPELLVVARVSGALRSVARTHAMGYGLGGEISLNIELVPLVALVFAYRESHAFVRTYFDAKVDDTERFATASALLRF
jgi:hypothetical protein